MPKPIEPTLEALPNAFLRYFFSNPPGISIGHFVGCLLGLAAASHSGIAIGPALATTTVFFALLAHAGANVINDYYDALSGCDAANSERQFPFTGGSRFIQNGVLTLRATGVSAMRCSPPSFPRTLADRRQCLGTAADRPGRPARGWSYSAPPLKLQSRGLGEFAVTASWLLVVIGSDFVQRHGFPWPPPPPVWALPCSSPMCFTSISFLTSRPMPPRERTRWWCAWALPGHAGVIC